MLKAVYTDVPEPANTNEEKDVKCPISARTSEAIHKMSLENRCTSGLPTTVAVYIELLVERSPAFDHFLYPDIVKTPELVQGT